MDKILCEYIEKLEEKQKKLQKIFEYISSKDFKISEDEMEHITNYFDKRDKLYDGLLSLETAIEKMKITDEMKKNDVVLKITKKNNLIIKNILSEDEKQQKTLNEIQNLLKKTIKSIKNTEKANKNYFGLYDNYSKGNWFDSQG